MSYTDFHSKYRPETLDRIIGHEAAVTRLKGMVASGNIPGAILFTGPSSVGKTTLARAFATAVNGKPIEEQRQDFKEVNAGETRSIDDMRDLIQLSKFRPSSKRRIFVLDEAQQIVTNPAAAAALLKPLEESSKGSGATTWILCSMDPSKFTTGNGKAIANRCTQFNLTPHEDSDLLKQAVRICKGENMVAYLEKEHLSEVVKACNGEMRTLANLLQGVRDYYNGLDKKPKKLAIETLTTVLQSSESQDDKLVVAVIAGVLTGKYAQVHRALLDVTEPFTFINKMAYASSFLLSNAVLDGARHPKVWWSGINKELVAKLKSANVTLGAYAALNEAVVNLKAQSANFTVDEISLISARMYRLIKDMFTK
jgi:DNA polymerase III gamma/tau subunit